MRTGQNGWQQVQILQALLPETSAFQKEEPALPTTKTLTASVLQLGEEEVRASSANITNAEVAVLYSCGMQELFLKRHESAYNCFQARLLSCLYLTPHNARLILDLSHYAMQSLPSKGNFLYPSEHRDVFLAAKRSCNSFNSGMAPIHDCQTIPLMHLHLQRCAPVMFKDPLLWLRMAECCLGSGSFNQPLSNIQDSLAGKTPTHCSFWWVLSVKILQELCCGPDVTLQKELNQLWEEARRTPFQTNNFYGPEKSSLFKAISKFENFKLVSPYAIDESPAREVMAIGCCSNMGSCCLENEDLILQMSCITMEFLSHLRSSPPLRQHFCMGSNVQPMLLTYSPTSLSLGGQWILSI